MKCWEQIVDDVKERYELALQADGRDDGFGNSFDYDEEEFLQQLMDDYLIVCDEEEVREIFDYAKRRYECGM
jgi:hypothetical protein